MYMCPSISVSVVCIIYTVFVHTTAVSVRPGGVVGYVSLGNPPH